MVIVGFIVGWRIHTSVCGLLGGIAIMLLFAHALSWVFALVGLQAANAEAAQAVVVPDPRPARVRVDRVRLGRVDARPARSGSPSTSRFRS